MKILVTGSAGFIGFRLCKKLIKEKASIIGVDNFNNYYDNSLKYDRISELLKIQKNLKLIFIIMK